MPPPAPVDIKPHNPLTEGAIFKALFFFTLPVLAGNVMQSINASVNSIWIGKYLGEAALTAASNSNNILFFLIGAVFGITIATTILVGQSVGAKNIDQAKRVIGTSATFFLAVAIGLAIVGFAIAPRLLEAMKTPADAIPLATAYLRIIFLGIPFIYMYSFLTMSLRGAGDSKTPFYFLFLSVGLDIALNPLFIFGWGPVPKMGIAGSATATLIAQAVSLFSLIFYIYKSKHFLRIQKHELHYLKVDGAILRSLIFKGLPMGMQMIVISSSMLTMISLVNGFGSQTGAAYGACLQLWNYIQMPAFAVGQAVSSMAAQNIGARRWDRVNAVAMNGVAFNFLLSGFLIALVLVFDRTTLHFFLNDGATITIGQHINVIAIWSFALFGVSMVLSGVVRATGAVIPPLIILFCAMWLVRIPFAHFMLPRWHADAIWWSFPISSLVSTLASMTYYRFGNWRHAQMLKPQGPTPPPVPETPPVPAATAEG